MACSSGWRVTGYYTPGEDQFSGEPTQIDVPGTGPDSYPSGFLRAVTIEGWGLTRHGWFLGWSGGAWTRSADALDARGHALRTGGLAVDPTVIRLGSTVTIPDAVPPWDHQVSTACDTGSDIRGKHVDIHCGAGKAAKAETFRVTADNRTVCKS
jgi:3D (Asp-Asp-Asp) domain-containing protein